MNNRKISIPAILILVLAVISLGVAFAAFSTTLTINGSGTVQATNWSIVFEGRTSTSTIDAPQTSGSATEVTRPTIKNDATEISTYSVTLQAPGDSITYKFKIHNKGSFDGNISAMTVSGVSRPSTAISGAALVTDSAVAQANAATLANVEYKFYYEADDTLVGQNAARDCLAVGESEDVVLRIVFAPSDDTSVLPSSNLTLDNLGISMTYTQASSCSSQSGGNSGGNSGGGSGIQGTAGTPTPSGSNEASSVSGPTVTNNSISGIEGNVPNAGDSIEYPLTLTSGSPLEITSVTVPSTSDLITANPDISPSILEDVEVLVTDSDGNIVSDTNTPCIKDTPGNYKVTLKYKQIPGKTQAKATSPIKIPTIPLTTSSVNTCGTSPTITYMNSASKEKINNEWNYSYTYTNSFSSLASINTMNNNIMPDTYIKKINNDLYNCIVLDSKEYCFGSDTTAQSLQSFCTDVGGTFNNFLGSWEDAGYTCSYYSNNNTSQFYVSYSDECWYEPGIQCIYTSKTNYWDYATSTSIETGCRIFNDKYITGCDYFGVSQGM